MLRVFLHEQSNPIQCSSGHRGDFEVAIAVVKQLKDGEPIRYFSRGVESYSPQSWFYKIEPASVNGTGPDTESEIVSTRSTLRKRPYREPFSEAERRSQKVYGPPGTGKTTKMMNIIRERLTRGVTPDDICFISYTNVAANEAIERAAREFNEYDPTDFPFFKTIHALATALGGLDGKTIMTSEDMERFDQTILSDPVWTEKGKAESIKVRSIHPCLQLKSIAKARKEGILEQLNVMSCEERGLVYDSVYRSVRDNDWFAPPLGTVEEAALFWLRAYERYKRSNNFIDYDDVIEKALTDEFDVSTLRFSLLIIDEAQDCSDFMWDFLKLLISESKEVYLCGDDDQAIMDGFGANSQAFLELDTTEPDDVLSKSWRLNVAHHDALLSEGGAFEVLQRFKTKRKEKLFTHNGSKEGCITRSILDNDQREVKLSLSHLIRLISINPNDDWLVMAPTRGSIDEISIALIDAGVSHYKSNRPVYIGDALTVNDIRVQTIHTSKGAEAKNVAIIMLSRTDRGMYSDTSSPFFNPTLRYVAESRSKENLYFV